MDCQYCDTGHDTRRTLRFWRAGHFVIAVYETNAKCEWELVSEFSK